MSDERGWKAHAFRSLTVWIVLLATLVKLTLAVSTSGTNDVDTWETFARAVGEFGPVGIYGHQFDVLYNHMPLSGWMLLGINGLEQLGPGVGVWIRVFATLADVAAAYLVWQLVRTFRPEREARFAAAAYAASPLMIIVSGFHGNTDPIFEMLVLLSLYLVHLRGRSFLAGVAFGLAVSLKLTPIILLPWLLYLAFRRGQDQAVRFVAGGALVFAILWLPVVLTRWSEFAQDGLAYAGLPLREWGVSQLITTMGPEWADAGHWFNTTGAVLAVTVGALVPFAVAGWQRERANWLALAGLPLTTFLLVSPAFGMQYLTWALAAAYLVNVRLATLYNVAASVFAVVVYSDWADAPPWRWDGAIGAAFSAPEVLLMAVTWTTLLVVVVMGRVEPVPDRPASVEPSLRATRP